MNPGILVTGASGLSGAIVVKEFARQNYPVRVLVRDRARVKDLEVYPRIEIVEGNMLQPSTMQAALNGIEKAFLISTANEQMVETQCSFVDSCKQAGVRHVVKFSGAEPDFDVQQFLFTRMHREIEHYIERSGLAWTHLRPSQFMQVYLREVPTIIKEDAFYLPFANIQLAPIDIADVARIAFKLLSGDGHEGRSFNMTGPEALTMTQIAERISHAAGRPVRYIPVSPEERSSTLLAAGVPRYFVDALTDQTHERLKRPLSRVCLEAHEEFDVHPTTFAQFAKRYAASFKR